MSPSSSNVGARAGGLRRRTAAGASSGTSAGRRTGPGTALPIGRGWRSRCSAAKNLACLGTSTAFRSARVDDEEVWSVVCFYVHPSAKREGVASALLEAAVAHVGERAARIIEGYAVAEGHMNIDAYTGYLPMFLEAGFEPVRSAGRRTIVRRRLV